LNGVMDSENQMINIKDLNNGVYYFVFQTRSKKEIFKLVKI
jgi:hypothetical protein